MKRRMRGSFFAAGLSLFAFLILTVLVKTVDVKPIGPLDSKVGLATINGAVFHTYGSNPIWYTLSEILGYLSIAVAAGFCLLGLWQWIQRKHLKKVDHDLLALYGAYGVMAAFYLLFEIVVINYRPILEEGALAPSYPSSHTLLVCCIMLTAVTQLRIRIRPRALRIAGTALCGLVILLTALGRIFSGVHWYTDVFASLLIGNAVGCAYSGVRQWLRIKARAARRRKQLSAGTEE